MKKFLVVCGVFGVIGYLMGKSVRRILDAVAGMVGGRRMF